MKKKTEREQTPVWLREAVLRRDNYKCVKCRKNFHRYPNHLEVHHILPVIYGGKTDIRNLAAVCYSCHKDAPNMPLEFGIYLSDHMTPEHRDYCNLAIFSAMAFLNKEGLLTKDNIDEYLDKVTTEVKGIYQLFWDCKVNKENPSSIDMLSALMAKLTLPT